MTTKLLGVMTGVALLASVGVTNAGQRAPLTDEQLDKVVAGTAIVMASVSNAVSVNSRFALSDNANGMRSAIIEAIFETQGPAPHIASVAASVAP